MSANPAPPASWRHILAWGAVALVAAGLTALLIALLEWAGVRNPGETMLMVVVGMWAADRVVR